MQQSNAAQPVSYRVMVDVHGRCISLPLYDVEGMLSPVQCRLCHAVYDLCGVRVIHRYADATVYRTPCCDKQVDDREWGTPAFRRLS